MSETNSIPEPQAPMSGNHELERLRGFQRILANLADRTSADANRLAKALELSSDQHQTPEEIEASALYARIDQELAALESRTERLMRHYDL